MERDKKMVLGKGIIAFEMIILVFSTVIISKLTSQGDNAGGCSGFAVNLLSPVNRVVIFLLALGAISGFYFMDKTEVGESSYA